MKPRRHLAFATFFASLLSSAAFGQGQVWVVDDDPGPGVSFNNIQSAVVAAADGDTILVKKGIYGPFAITNKTLVVSAEAGESVVLNGGFAVGPLGSTQAVAIRGISTTLVPGIGASIENCAGPVWIEDCVLRGHGAADAPVNAENGSPAARVAACASVSFTRCSFSGGRGGGVFDIWPNFPGIGGDGLQIAGGSMVTLYDCNLVAGQGGYANWNMEGADGGAAARLDAGFLWASGASFQGGDGGHGGHLSLTAGWCNDGGPGGDGLLLASAAAVAKVLGCSMAGGQGGPGGPGVTCQQGPPGLGLHNLGGVFADLLDLPRSLEATSPVRELQSSTLTFVGAPGELAYVLYSPFQSALYFEPFKGVLLPDLLYGAIVPAGTLGPAGELNVPVAIPALPPTVQGGIYCLQGLFYEPATVSLRIGAPSALVILDSTL